MLTEFLEKVVTHLAADARLSGVDILHEEQQDIESRVKKNMGPKLGSFILVKYGRMSSDSPDAPGGHLDSVALEVVCYESPVINRGQDRLTALQLAEVVAELLHWPNNPSEARLLELQTTFTGFGTSNQGSLLVWTAFFETNLTLQPE